MEVWASCAAGHYASCIREEGGQRPAACWAGESRVIAAARPLAFSLSVHCLAVAASPARPKTIVRPKSKTGLAVSAAESRGVDFTQNGPPK